MSDQEFEKRLEARLRAHAEVGVRPFDAMAIARQAIYGSGHGVIHHARRGMPVWFRSLVLAGLLVALIAAAAVVGGLIKIPGLIDPSPSPTGIAGLTPTPFLTPTIVPSPSLTVNPSPSGTGSPSIDPSVTPSGSPSPSPSVSPTTSPTSSPTFSPTASPTPGPTATATPATGWREIGFPGNPSRVRVMDSAYRDGIYVAVGDVIAFEPTGRAWRSTDGVNWTRALDAGFAGNVVAATDDGFIAIGPLGDETRVWSSVDGSAWTLLPASVDLGFINDLAYGNGVLVAVGTTRDFDAHAVWTSADGVAWTPMAPPEGCCDLTRVALRFGDIVVIGEDFNGHGRRLYVRLDHTSGWQRIDPFGEDVDGRLLDLASNGGRVVAVGYEDDFDTGERMATVRTSVDLTTWTRAVVSNDDQLIFDQVVALPDFRFLAIASVPSYIVGECQPDGCMFIEELGQAWLSEDGVAWQLNSQIYERNESLPDELGDEVGHRRAVVVGAAGVVVFDRWFDAHHVFFAPLGTFAE
ncbi:MAG: hypothetical protein M3253_07675 [Chloroflexota bacterium]|nr:hypothetical protein [Chloroflexota bacterium]